MLVHVNGRAIDRAVSCCKRSDLACGSAEEHVRPARLSFFRSSRQRSLPAATSLKSQNTSPVCVCWSRFTQILCSEQIQETAESKGAASNSSDRSAERRNRNRAVIAINSTNFGRRYKQTASAQRISSAFVHPSLSPPSSSQQRPFNLVLSA